MEYGNPMQASTQNAPAIREKIDGPQLISRLENELRGLIELRGRLRGVNRKLRGMQPESPKAAEVPKNPELSLLDITRDMELLLEQCHSEASEISSLLS